MYEEQIKKGLVQSEDFMDALHETHQKFMEMKRAGKAHNINVDEIMAQVKMSEGHGRQVMNYFHAEGAFRRAEEHKRKIENKSK